MKMINKVPKTLMLIESDFRAVLTDLDCRIKVENYDNDVYKTKILSGSTPMYEYHLSNYLTGAEQGDIGLNSKRTLIIRYNKVDDKLSVVMKTKFVHRTMRDDKVKYIPCEEVIFILSKAGCFRFLGKNIRRITFNSRLASDLFRKYISDCLLNELHDGIADRFKDLNYVPVELQKCRNVDEVKNKIDPNDSLNRFRLAAIIDVYSAFTKKAFKDLLKYVKNIKSKRGTGTTGLIHTYYTTRYPSYNNYNYSFERLTDLIITRQSNICKLKLPNHKKLLEYTKSIEKLNIAKHNNSLKVNFIKSDRGVKRLLSKLVKPNFKFTHEWIQTNEDLIDTCNEIGHLLQRKGCKKWWLRIYIKGSTLLMSPVDRHCVGDRIWSVRNEYMKIVLSHFDEDVVEKLQVFSNMRYPVGIPIVVAVGDDEDIPF